MTDFFLLLLQPFLVCVLMLLILGYMGLHVLKREVIFIDISLAQISAVGAIMAHMFFHAHEGSIKSYAGAFALTLAASFFFAFARKRVKQISLETIIGVTYAIAAAVALFFAGLGTGGHMHVQQMLAGSILWSTWYDVFFCSVLFFAVAAGFFVFRVPFRRISEDYEAASIAGVNVVLWDFLFYTLVGLVITLSVRIGGIVVVFSFLIMPALLSAVITSDWKKRLWVTWASALAAVICGFIFAQCLDFSIGPSVALFLGAELVLAGFLGTPGKTNRKGRKLFK